MYLNLIPPKTKEFFTLYDHKRAVPDVDLCNAGVVTTKDLPNIQLFMAAP